MKLEKDIEFEIRASFMALGSLITQVFFWFYMDYILNAIIAIILSIPLIVGIRRDFKVLEDVKRLSR